MYDDEMEEGAAPAVAAPKKEGGMDPALRAKAEAKLQELESMLEPEGVSLSEFVKEYEGGAEQPELDEAGDAKSAKKALIVEMLKRKAGGE